ncbi:hypothetical protein HPB51_015123 [Rhipicephalus microplus]|uniref:Uncharacterized protein n=1 Tax=Rhipicephalus microplus TaxID=6941 RepID=A0A9J6DNP4_RHIMP|nr:hypothetical protein HPB51_015123 [Rhipicephalus microplus]
MCPSWNRKPWCPCYEFDSDVFLECNSVTPDEIRSTLLEIHSPVKMLSIYNLQSNITTLPAGFFVNRTISRLFVSNTQLENVEEGVFEGLEDFLETLSLTQSKLKHVPKGALKDLRSLRSLELSSNNIASLESYVFYGLQLTNLQLSKNNITDVTEYAFGGLENSLEELNLIDSGQKEFPLNALRRLRSLKAAETR